MSTLDLPVATQTLERRSSYAVRYVESILPVVKEDPTMIVVMRATAAEQDIAAVLSRLDEHHLPVACLQDRREEVPRERVGETEARGGRTLEHDVEQGDDRQRRRGRGKDAVEPAPHRPRGGGAVPGRRPGRRATSRSAAGRRR